MGLFHWGAALFVLAKLRGDPKQRALVDLLIGAIEARKEVEDVLAFFSKQSWPRREQDQRLAHATTHINIARPDLCPSALDLCKFLYLRTTIPADRLTLSS